MSVTLSAPAKLTWSLRVTGVRADGYHLIDAEMVSLDLADAITLDECVGDECVGDECAGEGNGQPGATRIAVDGPFAAGVPTDGSNLVHAALVAVGRRAAVRLTKQVPNGGGLGGGSSNAAAILRWAGCRDPELAVGVGADVPFCLIGGRARVRGIGERIDVLPFVARTATIVVPPLAVSTPRVYAAWDALGGPTADGPNDLEPAALHVAPELVRWRDLIGDAVGETPVLAGSGASWFVPGDHLAAAAPLRARGATVRLVGTAPAS